MKYKIIKKIPYSDKKVSRPSVRIFQWPNGSFSLHIKRPTKHFSAASTEGWLIGNYFELDDAKEAVDKWRKKNFKKGA